MSHRASALATEIFDLRCTLRRACLVRACGMALVGIAVGVKQPNERVHGGVSLSGTLSQCGFRRALQKPAQGLSEIHVTVLLQPGINRSSNRNKRFKFSPLHQTGADASESMNQRVSQDRVTIEGHARWTASMPSAPNARRNL